jgi:hypothetical protein
LQRHEKPRLLDLCFIGADGPQELLLTVAGWAKAREPRHHPAQARKNGRSFELFRVGPRVAPDDVVNRRERAPKRRPSAARPPAHTAQVTDPAGASG